ncbi:hypothetical protein F2Q69_00057824 [Brassica cretica]|uniref:Uncharacterized protein n=1 Tax=Brassica cretica TaxID=69181 RepID=A0A8S9MQ09_BRACR|nr:hypothetical protein F2Q69_00057824 [Brassica cretica]
MVSSTRSCFSLLLDTCIGIKLFVSAQLLAGFDETAQGIDKSLSIDTETRIMEDELRKTLAAIFVENAKLRKQVNSAMLRALQQDVKTTKEDMNEKEEASTETLNISALSQDIVNKAQLLAGFDETAQGIDKSLSIHTETRIMEDELRKTLGEIFVENAKLRKQVNSAMLRALQRPPRKI